MFFFNSSQEDVSEFNDVFLARVREGLNVALGNDVAFESLVGGDDDNTVNSPYSKKPRLNNNVDDAPVAPMAVDQIQSGWFT